MTPSLHDQYEWKLVSKVGRVWDSSDTYGFLLIVEIGDKVTLSVVDNSELATCKWHCSTYGLVGETVSIRIQCQLMCVQSFNRNSNFRLFVYPLAWRNQNMDNTRYKLDQDSGWRSVSRSVNSFLFGRLSLQSENFERAKTNLISETSISNYNKMRVS